MLLTLVDNPPLGTILLKIFSLQKVQALPGVRLPHRLPCVRDNRVSGGASYEAEKLGDLPLRAAQSGATPTLSSYAGAALSNA